MKITTLFFCLAAFSLAHASQVDVPNSFTAGTPARANEINENFAALEAAIDDNAAQLDALKQAPPGATPLEVVQQNAAIDDLVDINGELITIAGLEFVRMDNDVDYVVEYPAAENLDVLALNVQWVPEPINRAPSPADIAAYEFTLNGFPTLLRQGYLQTQTAIAGGAGGMLAPIFRQTNILTVQVGPETLLNLQMQVSHTSVGSRAERQADLDTFLDLLPYFEVRPN